MSQNKNTEYNVLQGEFFFYLKHVCAKPFSMNYVVLPSIVCIQCAQLKIPICSFLLALLLTKFLNLLNLDLQNYHKRQKLFLYTPINEIAKYLLRA